MEKNADKEARKDKYASLHICLKKELDKYKKNSFAYAFIIVLSVAITIVLHEVQTSGSVFWGITNHIYLDIAINIALLDMIFGVIVFSLFSLLKWNHNRKDNRMKKIFEGLFKEEQNKKEEEQRDLEQIVKEKKSGEKPIYKYLSTTKHVTIFSDCHGIVQRTAEIEILDKKNFTAINYWFELDKSTIEGLKFEGDLKQMSGDGVITGADRRKKRFSGQTFVGKLFSMDKKEVINDQRELKIISVEQQANKKNFDIEFSKPTIKGNSVLKFGWAWTSDKLYPAKKEDKEKCVEKLKLVESSIIIDTETDFLKLIISFEDEIKIDEYNVPTLYRKPKGGAEKEVGILEKENDMYYVRYKRDIPNPKVGDKYTVRWDYA